MTKELAEACRNQILEQPQDRRADDDGDAMRNHDEGAVQTRPN